MKEASLGEEFSRLVCGPGRSRVDHVDPKGPRQPWPGTKRETGEGHRMEWSSLKPLVLYV